MVVGARYKVLGKLDLICSLCSWELMNIGVHVRVPTMKSRPQKRFLEWNRWTDQAVSVQTDISNMKIDSGSRSENHKSGDSWKMQTLRLRRCDDSVHHSSQQPPARVSAVTTHNKTSRSLQQIVRSQPCKPESEPIHTPTRLSNTCHVQETHHSRRRPGL